MENALKQSKSVLSSTSLSEPETAISFAQLTRFCNLPFDSYYYNYYEKKHE